MKKIIVLPTYNERDNLPKIVEAIFNLKIENLHIIVVDDASPDGTGKIADELADQYSVGTQNFAFLQVIHRQSKLGLGSAYIAGFKKALAEGADLIFEMDADFSHHPSDIKKLINAVENGADVAIGSRRVTGGSVRGWSQWRDIQSRLAMLFARKILNLKTRDITAGFRCYRRHVLDAINLDGVKSNGYAFQEEMIYLCERRGFKITEVPITFIDREYGRSKLGIKDVIEFFLTIFRLRFFTYPDTKHR